MLFMSFLRRVESTCSFLINSTNRMLEEGICAFSGKKLVCIFFFAVIFALCNWCINDEALGDAKLCVRNNMIFELS